MKFTQASGERGAIHRGLAGEPIYLYQLLRKPLSKEAGVPLMFPWKYKWIIGPLWFGVGVLLYLFSNHHFIFQAKLLKMSRIDQAIPFFVGTIWIYVSEAGFVLTAFLLNRCWVSLNIHLYSFMTLVVISCIFFSLYPTVYPRELYATHSLNPGLSERVLFGLWDLDQATNCLPSLHVSVAFQIALGFLEDRKEWFPWMLIWSLLISISTLTIKQHYLMDVFAGLLLAAALHYFFHHKLTYRVAELSYLGKGSFLISGSRQKIVCDNSACEVWKK